MTARRRVLAGVRLGLLAGGDEAAAVLAGALTEEGAQVERLDDSDLQRAAVRELDAVVVRVPRTEGTGVPPSAGARRADLVQGLAHEQRVLALLDDAPAATVAATCDFALPPFETAEVIPRLVRLLRMPRPSPTVRFGSLELNVARRTAACGGTALELTFNEFEVLSELAGARGAVVSRDELHRRLGGQDTAQGRRIDIHIHRLRGKLGRSSAVNVETVRNVGYRLSLGRPGG